MDFLFEHFLNTKPRCNIQYNKHSSFTSHHKTKHISQQPKQARLDAINCTTMLDAVSLVTKVIKRGLCLYALVTPI